MFSSDLRIFFFIFLFGGALIGHSNAEVNNKSLKADKSHHSIDNESGKRISHMDLLIESLKNQKWEPNEAKCELKILNIMNNVKNSTLWATWIWDAMQSPVGHLFGSKYSFGNYDQCMNAPWLDTHPEYRTQYCLADIKLSTEEVKKPDVDPEWHVKNYINRISKYGLRFNQLKLGVCLPVECKPKSVSKFVKILFEDTHLGNAVPDVHISVIECQIAGAPPLYTTKYYVIVTLLALVIVTAVICTFFGNEKQQDTFGSKLINAFCIKSNTLYLSKSSEDDIKVMHGIRSITAGIVMGLHVFFLTNWIGTGNALQVEMFIDKYNLSTLFHMELVVDTFLMMSGLLLIKGLMASKTVNPLLLILKRYLRLVFVIGLFLMVSLHVAVYFGDGPLWPTSSRKEVEICNKNWWPNFLMLGNYIDTANMCYPVLWSVPVDFHMFAVGIMMYWIYTKNRRIGLSIFGTLFIAAIVLPGLVTYQRRLPGSPSFDLHAMPNYRTVILTNPTYVWTHLRAGPYFIGIIAGYIISIYKPAHHRNIISKLCSTIGIITALIIATALIILGGTFHDPNKPYNVWEAVIFASLNRSLWALAIASVILLCEYGNIPLVANFLSLEVWLPLSKLTYGVYLLHTIVFSCVVVSMRSPLNLSMFLVLFNTAGVIVVSNIFSYFLHLFFEAPMSKILNILIDNKVEKRKTEDETTTKNKIL